MNLIQYDPNQRPTPQQKDAIASFLFTHLEQYGDELSAIKKAMDFALQESQSFGGLILALEEDGELLGATVINRTGMDEYIPENILVYIATHHGHRGKGIGKRLMQAAIDTCQGSIALHVEPDNPAKKLYEKLGFTNKYLEMRLVK